MPNQFVKFITRSKDDWRQVKQNLQKPNSLTVSSNFFSLQRLGTYICALDGNYSFENWRRRNSCRRSIHLLMSFAYCLLIFNPIRTLLLWVKVACIFQLHDVSIAFLCLRWCLTIFYLLMHYRTWWSLFLFGVCETIVPLCIHEITFNQSNFKL